MDRDPENLNDHSLLRKDSEKFYEAIKKWSN